MNQIQNIVHQQRLFYNTHKTINIYFHKQALRQLRNGMYTYEKQIHVPFRYPPFTPLKDRIVRWFVRYV